jgi:adenylate kinase family enzyme
MLDKQELIDGNVLVPTLTSELERLGARGVGKKAVLMDGFPRNLAQLRKFELLVSLLASKLHRTLAYCIKWMGIVQK